MSDVVSKQETPEGRIVVTVDAEDDFLRLRHLAMDLGPRARAFKLGQGLLLQDRPWPLVQSLRLKGATVDLDAKYEEDPDQMGSIVLKAFRRGFMHVSVAPAAQVDALVRAAEVAPPEHGLFVSLPSANSELLIRSLDNVMDANSRLPCDKKISEVMCNVHDVERIKGMGNFAVIATGIRLPGDTPDDHPYVATPAEALAAGADFLAVGRSITQKDNPAAAFDQVLENIANYL